MAESVVPGVELLQYSMKILEVGSLREKSPGHGGCCTQKGLLDSSFSASMSDVGIASNTITHNELTQLRIVL